LVLARNPENKIGMKDAQNKLEKINSELKTFDWEITV